MPGNDVSGRVLIADDDSSVRAFARRVIESIGLTVLEAANGREALELSRDTYIDVAVMDLVMPEMDGLEAMRELRKRQPDIKIVVFSGALPAHFLELAGLLGAARVLPKPVRAEDLQEAVTALLTEKR